MTSALALLDRAKIVIRREDHTDWSWKELAEECKCSVNQARYWSKKGSDIQDHIHPGRPKKVTGDMEIDIQASLVATPRISMRRLGREYGLSEETTRRTVIGLGFEYLEPFSMPPLGQRHMENRVNFSNLILAQPNNIPKIVFTDESMVCFEPARKRLWRIPGEFIDEWQVPVTEQPIRRMVWGAIGWNYKSPLVIIDGTLRGNNFVQLLETNGIFADLERQFPGKSYFLQMDNAKCHTAKAAKEEFNNKQVPLLLMWPSRSPDLNPIEQLWSKLKDMLPLENITTQAELDNAIRAAWDSIDLETINNFIGSFPARLQTCIGLGGKCLNGHWREVHQLHHQAN
jgi:hypothetical protein